MLELKRQPQARLIAVDSTCFILLQEVLCSVDPFPHGELGQLFAVLTCISRAVILDSCNIFTLQVAARVKTSGTLWRYTSQPWFP